MNQVALVGRVVDVKVCDEPGEGVESVVLSLETECMHKYGRFNAMRDVHHVLCPHNDLYVAKHLELGAVVSVVGSIAYTQRYDLITHEEFNSAFVAAFILKIVKPTETLPHRPSPTAGPLKPGREQAPESAPKLTAQDVGPVRF